MQDNISYQKTDFGSETADILNSLVPQKRKVAEISLENDITVAQLQVALSVPSKLSQLINDADFVDKAELNTETNERQQSDNTLQTNIDNEANSRKSSDNILQKNIDNEANSRKSSDDILQKNIDTEATYRKNADTQINNSINSILNDINAIIEDIEALQNTSHSHENKDVIDSITSERVAMWDKISEMDDQLEYVGYKEYINDILFGFSNELQTIYSLIGIISYDGGLFGMTQDGDILDGGAFTDTELDGFDCGDFEPLTVTTTAVIDGGNY